MRSILLCFVIGFVQVSAQATDEFHFVDLGPHFNQKLTDNLGRGFDGNHLKALPTGEQTFESLKFRVGDGIVQLGSTVLTKMPEKIKGIAVGRKLSKLHFLHATMYGGGPNISGTELFVKDGTLIGEYLVNYEDQSSEGISIIYGTRLRDWFYRADEEGVSEGKIAWKGDNAFATQQNCGIRLYTLTWENPKPNMKVVSIDYVGRKNESVAAPFCVAITAQRHAEENAARASLAGTVTSSGRPVVQGRILLYAEDGQIFGSLIKGVGTYAIRDVPVGEYTVTIDGEGVSSKYSKNDGTLKCEVRVGRNTLNFDLVNTE